MSDDITLIKARVDIIDLIGSYVQLKRSGRNFVACCPFHQEKSPSFTIFQDSQSFKCFGCQKGGDIFTFIMDHEGLSFPEAMEHLAKEAGVELKPKQSRNPGHQGREKLWKKALNVAGHFFRNQFFSDDGAPAREYLAARGFTDETMDFFKVGYAPDSFDAFLKHARSNGLTDDDLLTMGLIKRSESGRLFDFFRNRVIFPVRNPQGQVVAFGGRVLDGTEPKYLNSPETPLFSKTRTLYNFHHARTEVKGFQYFLMMEGYTDVMMAYQAGVGPAVATLGTAMTEEHVRMLKRHQAPLYLVYDADNAGRRAMDRALPFVIKYGMETRVLSLPEGQDPCDFLLEAEDPKTRWKDCMTVSEDAFVNKVQHLIQEKGCSSSEQKLSIAKLMLEDLKSNRDPLRESVYLDELSKLLEINRESLGASREQDAPSLKAKNVPPKAKDYPRNDAFFLLSICLHQTSYRSRIEELPRLPDDSSEPAKVLLGWLENNTDLEIDQAHPLFMEKLSQPQRNIFLDALQESQSLPDDEVLRGLYQEKVESWVGMKVQKSDLKMQLEEAVRNGDEELQLKILKTISESRRQIN
jgi:DNA primase